MGFLRRVIVPDLQQLLVPSLMAGLIVVMLLTGSMARSAGHDRTLAFASSESEIDRMVIDNEYAVFDDVPGDRVQRREDARTQAQERIAIAKSDLVSVITGGLLHWTYNTPLYILMPSSPSAFIETDHSARIYPRSAGYFMSGDVPAAMVLEAYQRDKITNLTNRVNDARNENKTSWTLEEYRQKIEEIRSVSYDDTEVRSYIEHMNSSADRELVIEDPVVKRHVIEATVKEVGYREYLPAIVGNFLLYYLVFGLLTAMIGLVVGSDADTNQKRTPQQPRRQGPSQNRRRSSR
ncbi:MAG: hypothetical protein MUP66_00520 [Candidatus Nanohaloarchaeota archaeon QJJ-5]|nr:hypothetical protein [Candidatus Nanohaloarchaeota archaeon QJJ-5]